MDRDTQCLLFMVIMKPLLPLNWCCCPPWLSQPVWECKCPRNSRRSGKTHSCWTQETTWKTFSRPSSCSWPPGKVSERMVTILVFFVQCNQALSVLCNGIVSLKGYMIWVMPLCHLWSTSCHPRRRSRHLLVTPGIRHLQSGKTPHIYLCRLMTF